MALELDVHRDSKHSLSEISFFFFFFKDLILHVMQTRLVYHFTDIILQKMTRLIILMAATDRPLSQNANVKRRLIISLFIDIIFQTKNKPAKKNVRLTLSNDIKQHC